MRGLVLHGRTGRFTWRMGAAVLAGQSVAVFFGALVARALAVSQGSPSSVLYLTAGSVLAFLCVLAAALMRGPWGVSLGWLVQLATLLSALVVPAMLLVGVMFGALWVTSLVQGHRIDALPAGRAGTAGTAGTAGRAGPAGTAGTAGPAGPAGQVDPAGPAGPQQPPRPPGQPPRPPGQRPAAR